MQSAPFTYKRGGEVSELPGYWNCFGNSVLTPAVLGVLGKDANDTLTQIMSYLPQHYFGYIYGVSVFDIFLRNLRVGGAQAG